MKMKMPKPPPVPAPPPVVPLPTMDDQTVDTRKRAALAEMRTRKGRRSTLLSNGPLGDGGAMGGGANYSRAQLS